MNNSRCYNLDFIKFLCCISILIVHSTLIGFNVIQNRTDIGVSFFFILSGFFLFPQIEKNISYQDFIVKKYIRLMPVVILSFLLIYCLNHIGLITQEAHFKDNFMTLFFIRNIAIFNDATEINFFYNNSHIWYLGPLFWASLFYLALFKIIPFKVSTFIVIILTYVGIIIYINRIQPPAPGLFGVWKGLSGIGLGLLIRIFISRINFLKPQNKKTTIWYTLLELFFLGLFLDLLFFNTVKLKEYAYGMVVFSVLVILFFVQKGGISRWLNQPFLGKLGVYSYSIYILQYIPQILFVKGNFLGDSQFYMHLKAEYPASTCYLVAVVFPCVLGVIGYYLCEKKAYEKLLLIYKTTRGSK